MNNTLKKIKILIVDDDPDVRESLSDVLKDEGYEIYIAGNGGEAIALAREVKLNLALVDIKLPDIDGFKLTEQILDIHLYAYIIIMTGYDYPKAPYQAGGAGAYYYITKPIDVEELLKTIREIVEKQKKLNL